MNADNAQEAVKYAKLNPGSWIGDGKHSKRVIFNDGTYTVETKGESLDFRTDTVAAECLNWQWWHEDKNA